MSRRDQLKRKFSVFPRDSPTFADYHKEGGKWKRRNTEAMAYGSIFRRRGYSTAKRATYRRSGAKKYKRFKTKGKRKGGRRGGRRRNTNKTGKPKWFKTLCKDHPPQMYSGSSYGNAVNTSVNQQWVGASFSHLSVTHISQGCSLAAGGTAGTNNSGVGGGNANTAKAYITDVISKHMWRNNSTAVDVEMKVYVLRPKRHITVQMGQMFPPFSVASLNQNLYNGPSMINRLLIDEKTADPAIAPGTGTGLMLMDNPQWTPYKTPGLSNWFKIKKLKFKGADGVARTFQIVKPGQSITITKTYKGPLLCDYAKWFLDATSPRLFEQVFQGVKQTPLLLWSFNGTVAHDSVNESTVFRGLVGMDYVNEQSWKFWVPSVPQYGQRSLGHYFGGEPSGPFAAEQANEAKGEDEKMDTG